MDPGRRLVRGDPPGEDLLEQGRVCVTHAGGVLDGAWADARAACCCLPGPLPPMWQRCHIGHLTEVCPPPGSPLLPRPLVLGALHHKRRLLRRREIATRQRRAQDVLSLIIGRHIAHRDLPNAKLTRDAKTVMPVKDDPLHRHLKGNLDIAPGNILTQRRTLCISHRREACGKRMRAQPLDRDKTDIRRPVPGPAGRGGCSRCAPGDGCGRNHTATVGGPQQARLTDFTETQSTGAGAPEFPDGRAQGVRRPGSRAPGGPGRVTPLGATHPLPPVSASR